LHLIYSDSHTHILHDLLHYPCIIAYFTKHLLAYKQKAYLLLYIIGT